MNFVDHAQDLSDQLDQKEVLITELVNVLGESYQWLLDLSDRCEEAEIRPLNEVLRKCRSILCIPAQWQQGGDNE